MNDPGIEGDVFLYQSAHEHMEAGRKVVFVVTDRSPDRVVETFAAYGFGLKDLRGQLHIVDAYSPMMGLRHPDTEPIEDVSDVAHWALTLNRVADAHPDAVLLVDSLSTLADHMGVQPFLSSLPMLSQAFHRFQMTAALFTRWPYEEALDRLYQNFDGVVALNAVRERVVVSQFFSVRRADWVEGLDDQPRLYKTLRPGGVVVYIPKIVVTGPFNAGKSTFVRTISDENVSVDRMGTTVALDHGQVQLDGVRADVFGTPGQSRFDPILRIIAGQALGVVVVVDSTKPDSFPRAQEMMSHTSRKGLPVIIAANKQDEPGALRPQEVAQRLDVPDHVTVVGCSAHDAESGRAVLMTLIDAIMAGDQEADVTASKVPQGGVR